MVQGLGLRVWDVRVWDLGFRVLGLGQRVRSGLLEAYIIDTQDERNTRMQGGPAV